MFISAFLCEQYIRRMMLSVKRMAVLLLLGAILVFLPGYDEIITVRDRIQDEKRFSDSSRSVA